MRTCAIIVAAGTSARLPGAVPKQFRPVAGRPILGHTLRAFDLCDAVDDVVAVVPEEHLLHTTEAVVDRFRIAKVVKVVPGGSNRCRSVVAGLRAAGDGYDIAVVHDGVRPLVTPRLISLTVSEGSRHGAAVAALPVGETVKRGEGDFVIATLDRSRLYSAQTPQAFRTSVLVDSYEKVGCDGGFTDDAAVVEAAGYKVRLVAGELENLKITYPLDIELMKVLLSHRSEDAYA